MTSTQKFRSLKPIQPEDASSSKGQHRIFRLNGYRVAQVVFSATARATAIALLGFAPTLWGAPVDAPAAKPGASSPGRPSSMASPMPSTSLTPPLRQSADYPPPPAAPVRLDVRGAIALALVQGPAIVGGTLDRESQRILNEAAARIFKPRASLNSSHERKVSVTSTDRTVTTNPVYGLSTSVKAITGAEIKAGLSQSGSSSVGSNPALGSIELTQPLLRGGGIRIGTLEQRSLTLSEQNSVLGLEAVKRATVADAFGAYYALYEARQSRAIAMRALTRARESAAVNQLLVETGRLARIDLLQTRADVARAELQSEQAERAENDVQRRLAVVLGLPSQTQFDLPQLIDEPPPLTMDADAALLSAWNQRIEVRTTENAISAQRLSLERAEDDLLPRLDLSLRSEQAVGRVANDGSGLDAQRPRSHSAGLSLEVPLTRSDVRAARSAAKIGLQRAEITLNDLRVSIETEIRNAIEGFGSAQRSLALAQTTLDLQRGRLDADNEKLKVGRASISQVSDAQESVRSAERDALSARLDLVRKRFEFDQALGRSVELWSRPTP